MGASGDAAARDRALKLCRALKVDQTAEAALRRRAEELEGQLLYGDAAREVVEARAKLAAGDARTAAAMLEKVTAAHADLEEAQYLLGLTYVNPDIGRRADAKNAWRRAPHVKEAQLALGVDSYESGDLDEAQKALAVATALDGGYQAAY